MSYNEKFLKYYNILAIYNSDDILENARERIFVRSSMCIVCILVSLHTKEETFFTDSFHQRYLKKCLLTVELSTQNARKKFFSTRITF